MPKEYINNRYLMPNQLTGEGDQPDSITFLTVGWDRMGSAQLAIQPKGDYDVHDRPGYWIDLDRDGINKLIRTLRKARDQAFGSDA